MVVDKAGQNFLAGAGRAVDENSDIGLRDTASQTQKITADLVATGDSALVRKKCGGQLQAVMVGSSACGDSRKRQTDELSAKCFSDCKCACIFLDNHHSASPGGASARQSCIFATNRCFKGFAAYIGGRFDVAGTFASSFTDRQQPIVQKLGQYRRGAEFGMFKANGAHLFCLKRSFLCRSRGKNPAST